MLATGLAIGLSMSGLSPRYPFGTTITKVQGSSSQIAYDLYDDNRNVLFTLPTSPLKSTYVLIYSSMVQSPSGGWTWSGDDNLRPHFYAQNGVTIVGAFSTPTGPSESVGAFKALYGNTITPTITYGMQSVAFYSVPANTQNPVIGLDFAFLDVTCADGAGDVFLIQIPNALAFQTFAQLSVQDKLDNMEKLLMDLASGKMSFTGVVELPPFKDVSASLLSKAAKNLRDRVDDNEREALGFVDSTPPPSPPRTRKREDVLTPCCENSPLAVRYRRTSK
jgi:hypothetical protein